MRAWSVISDLAERQRGTLLLWMPFGLALGIGAYFSLQVEPGLNLYGWAAGAATLALLAARKAPFTMAVPLIALLLVAMGFINAGANAHRKAAPVLSYHYYGPVEGRIIAVDRSSSNMPRITLDQIHLKARSKARTPHNLRISLHYPRLFTPLEPGRHVMVTASLSPPSGPVEPGGFDFQRFAWFRSLGAIGYSRTPLVEVSAPDQSGWSMGLMRLRMRLAAGIRARIDGQTGAFAAAILTGDRSAIAPEMLTRLRASNLAHLLAISGLHMGLLTGFVFAWIRYGLALSPYLALRLPAKKIAAVGAFIAAISYLFLSGANVATQRAFVMVAVMLLAILLDRRALTLRAVALAAVIVLMIRPESLIEAGFQMSFAATTALVAVFAGLRDYGILVTGGGLVKNIARWALALLLSSAVAGLATAPISAFHFNQIAQFGLVANLASVPVMGMLVMPSAVVAVVLLPFGLDGLAWEVMGAGIGWILFVAGKIASLNGAVVHVVKPPTLVLALIASGGMIFVLLRSRLRFAAFGLVLFGFWMWNTTQRPDILLSANGRLMGVLGTDGRALNRAKGTGFVARNWLENDGDPASQQQAADRLIQAKAAPQQSVKLGAHNIVYSWSKDIDFSTLQDLCKVNSLLILPQSDAVLADCQLIGKTELRHLGAIAISQQKGGLIIKSARQQGGARLWSR